MLRAISNDADLSGYDIAVSPNGGVTAGVLHRGYIDIDGEFVPGLEGTNLGIFTTMKMEHFNGLMV